MDTIIQSAFLSTEEGRQRLKKLNIATYFLIAFFITITLILPSFAHAGDSGMDFLESMVKQITSGGGTLMKSIFDDGDSDTVFAGITTYIKGGDDGMGALTKTTFYTLLAQCAGLWVVAVSLIQYLEKLAKGQMADPVEDVFYMLIRCCGGILVIMYCGDIIDGLTTAGFALGNNLVSSLSFADVENAADTDAIIEAITGSKSASWILVLVGIIKCMIPYLFSYVIELGQKFVALGIFVEIIIRRVFFPFAIADLFNEGLRSTGMVYFKKYFGCYVRLIICAVASFASGKISTEMWANVDTFAKFLEAATSSILVGLTTIGVMMRGSEIANDIVGAH